MTMNCLMRSGRFGLALLVCAAAHVLLAPLPAAARSLSAPLPDPVSEGLQISDPSSQGYIAEEYFLSGAAPVLETVTMVDAEDTMGIDNTALMSKQDSYARTVVAPDRPYIGRLIVYRPEDADRFTGNVIVETMHPTGGGRAIIWSSLNPFFMRRGDAYVIVQHPATFDGLKYADSERYADLSAEASSQLWGMLADTGRLLKTSGIGGLQARHLFMTGYSYTGVATATFADYHHDSSRLQNGDPIYDGYFPMAAGMYVRDLDVPVMILMTNSDFNIFGSVANRKPDSDHPDSRYRLYEIAGPSHSVAPRPQAGAALPPRPMELPEAEGMPNFSPEACFEKFPAGWQRNDFPLRHVQAALFENLIDWVAEGRPPPPGARIEIGPDGQPRLDAYGNALGGVRLPPVTVPARTYGMGKNEDCFLFGYTLPFQPERLQKLYGNHETYVEKVREAAQQMVEQRLLLPEGAAELVDWAESSPEF